VESAILRIEPAAAPVVTDAEQAAFSAFVIAVFGLRRKQMRRVVRTLRGLDAVAAERVLAEADVATHARPEVLSPAQLAAVWRLTR
jgi:16S rRNA (adenine1518-N6/adenine1519-N6)-dimethyltransferase